MIEKMPHTIGDQIFSLKCGFGIDYGIGQKYRPIWVSVSDLNQNNGFGRTLKVRSGVILNFNCIELLESMQDIRFVT